MRTRLDQLTLQDLIELSCGDYDVLKEGDELVEEKEITSKATRIMREYKSIASPTQAKMDLADEELLTKMAIKETCARIAMAMCKSGHSDNAREILSDMSIEKEFLQTDEMIIARCQSIIGEAEYERQRLAEHYAKRNGEKTVEEVRHSWYSEIASVMTILKVPIDMRINAAIYANLVHQAVERNKAMAKMPPMAGMFM